MRLQHPVLPAEVTLAEPAVAYDALGSVFAVLCATSDLLGCAASDGQSHVQGAFAGDVGG